MVCGWGLTSGFPIKDRGSAAQMIVTVTGGMVLAVGFWAVDWVPAFVGMTQAARARVRAMSAVRLSRVIGLSPAKKQKKQQGNLLS